MAVSREFFGFKNERQKHVTKEAVHKTNIYTFHLTKDA